MWTMAQIDHVIKLLVSDFPFLLEQTVKTYSNAYETVSDASLIWSDRVCVAKHRERKTGKKRPLGTAIYLELLKEKHMYKLGHLFSLLLQTLFLAVLGCP